MSIQSVLFSFFAQWKVAKELQTHKNAAHCQNKIFRAVIHKNKNTLFGHDHSFSSVSDIKDYQAQVPIRSYEAFLPYIEKIKQGRKDILCKEKIEYLLVTSGTTAGSKFIPITNKGIRHQIDAALKVLCFYAVNSRKTDFIDYKMIFLQGSPALDTSLGIPCGRLSGVVYHHVPKFFQRNKLPSYEANITIDWQEKLTKIVDETWKEDISILGGIPPWCLQYFELLLKKSGSKSLDELFPHLAMYIHGGLDFRNYRESIQRVLGKDVALLQTFPASEGFFALQDKLGAEDMLLLLKQGIFYEFRLHPAQTAEVFTIEQVELQKHYELIITNTSGLYRYAMGDIIEFTSLAPYRIQVVGRTSQYISAFGEHVIAYEVEKTIEKVSKILNLPISDYYVYACVEDKQYVWQIEFEHTPSPNKLLLLENQLDEGLADLNKYYAHLLNGQIIQSCRIRPIQSGAFQAYRKRIGKVGEQNKIIRLGKEALPIEEYLQPEGHM